MSLFILGMFIIYLPLHVSLSNYLPFCVTASCFQSATFVYTRVPPAVRQQSACLHVCVRVCVCVYTLLLCSERRRSVGAVFGGERDDRR